MYGGLEYVVVAGCMLAGGSVLLLEVRRIRRAHRAAERRYYTGGQLAWTLFKRRPRQPRLTDQRNPDGLTRCRPEAGPGAGRP